MDEVIKSESIFLQDNCHILDTCICTQHTFSYDTFLTLVLGKLVMSSFENIVDSDQMASEEAV